MTDVVLGIDLGTTNSVVAVADGAQCQVLTTELGHRLIPSVVSFKPDGGIVVGEEARERRLLDAKHTVYSVKRLIGRPFRAEEVRRATTRFAFELVRSPNGGVVVQVRDESYTLTEISAFVLREIRRIAELQLGQPCRRAVITVPANFNELQRSATKAAGRVAGLEVERIVNEPTAAALAYGYGKDKPERVAVFDLGGGTFDMTLLELENDVFEVLATAGDSFLGGDDIDLLIAERMAEAFLTKHGWDIRQDDQGFERIRAAAEWAKCQVSANDSAHVLLEDLGTEGSTDFEFTLARTDFEALVRPTIARAFDVCQQAFAEALVKPSDIDNVVLVGGSTRIPLVRSMVEFYFDAKPRVEFDPDLVVAQGAAIHGYALSGVKKPTAALGRVGLKKISRGELDRLKKERERRKAGLPKQPAFAPAPVVKLKDIPRKEGRATQPPPALPALPPARPPSAPPAGLSLDTSDLPGAIVAPPLRPLELDAEGLPGVVSAAPPARESSVLEDLDFDDLESVHPAAPPPPPPPPARPPSSADMPAIPGVVRASVVAVGRPAPPPPERPPERHPAFTTPFEEDGLPSLPDDLPGLEPKPDGGRHTLDPALFGSAPPPAAEPEPAPDAGLAFEMAERSMPLLMDVTPHSLGVEMAGGYCQTLIKRNAPIPSEQSQVFTTALDGQEGVHVRVCQGEQRTFAANDPLGEIELTGLRSATRGEVKIDVTFMLDASGTLAVSAVDLDTGVRQAIQINLLGGADDDEIAAMKKRQDALLS